MRDELDEIHVDLAILFPDHLLKLPVLTQTDYAAALARAYNAWLVDKWTSAEKGLLGVHHRLPPRSPRRPRARSRSTPTHPDVVGVYLPCAGIDPLWGHRTYDPIYAGRRRRGPRRCCCTA